MDASSHGPMGLSLSTLKAVRIYPVSSALPELSIQSLLFALCLQRHSFCHEACRSIRGLPDCTPLAYAMNYLFGFAALLQSALYPLQSSASAHHEIKHSHPAPSPASDYTPYEPTAALLVPRQASTSDTYSCDKSNPCSNGACCGASGYCGYGPTYCGTGIYSLGPGLTFFQATGSYAYHVQGA